VGTDSFFPSSLMISDDVHGSNMVGLFARGVSPGQATVLFLSYICDAFLASGGLFAPFHSFLSVALLRCLWKLHPACFER